MSSLPSATPEATPDDVAALLTARTKDAAGRELGTWTSETRPTAEQVQVRIDIARSMLQQEAGPIPDPCLEITESTVALLAALLTEAAFWPEQTSNDQSTYARLRDLYTEARSGMLACVAYHTDQTAFELNVGLGDRCAWPFDWWQRNLDTASPPLWTRPVPNG